MRKIHFVVPGIASPGSDQRLVASEGVNRQNRESFRGSRAGLTRHTISLFIFAQAQAQDRLYTHKRAADVRGTLNPKMKETAKISFTGSLKVRQLAVNQYGETLM